MSDKVREKKYGKTVKRVLLGVLIVCVAGMAATAGVVAYFIGDGVRTYGELSHDKLSNMPLTTRVYDRYGADAAALHGSENRLPVTLGDLPSYVVQAFLAAEDTRFYEHVGVDVKRILGAAVHDIRTGGLTQGASTITQQLVKLTHLSAEKTWTRKLYEAYLAVEVEKHFTKEEIITSYLSVVYFGSGAYGIESAAQTFFDRPAKELSVAQAALLAGILKSPTYFDPHVYPDAALERRGYVLGVMRDNGMIDQNTYEQAKTEKMKVAKRESSYPYGWFLDRVAYEAQLALDVSADDLLTGGYAIYTTLDPEVQTQCEEIVSDPGMFPPDASDGTLCQVGAAIIENDTGDVLALIGGREHSSRRAFSRATDARRQPGSALKPIAVYSPAVERGAVPTTFMDDTYADFGGWTPRNFNDKYMGLITLRNALARSQNVASVKLLESIGVDAAMDSLKRYGLPVTQNDAYLPIALGSMYDGVTPLEMARAYAALGNGGVLPDTSVITSIRDVTGREVWRRTPSPSRAASPEAAYMVTDMLRSAAEWGTAKPVGQLGFPAAAKTGTVSQDGGLNRDAWTCAYTTGVTVAVWMGFDTPSQTHALPASITGGTMPAKLAASLLSAAYQGADPKSVADFVMPATVHRVNIDGWTLDHEYRVALANDTTPSQYVVQELFLASNMPWETTQHWVPPQLPAGFSVSAGPEGMPEISLTAVQDFARYRVYRRRGGEAPVEVAALTGLPGERLITIDHTAERGAEYQYLVTAENAESQDAGLNTRTPYSMPITYFVPPAYGLEVLPGIRLPLDMLPDSSAEPVLPSVPVPSASPSPAPATENAPFGDALLP